MFNRLRNAILLLVLLRALTGYSTTLSAQDNSVLTLSEYADELQTIRSTMDNANDPTAALNAADERLQQVLTVTLPSGAALAISPLLNEVSDPAVALQRIDTTLDQISRSANDHTDQRLAQLQAVLDRRPSNPFAQWWERIQQWLRDFFRQFERDIPPPQAVLTTGQTAGWVILAVAALLIALLLGFWLQGILGNIIADRRLRRNGEDDLPATAAEAREEAQQLAQAGNYREAVRHLYLAALLGLDESGLIRYDRTLTNREVLAQTQSEAAVQSHLRPVVETFDQVWYGIHEPDQSSYSSYVREIDQLEEIVKQNGDTR